MNTSSSDLEVSSAYGPFTVAMMTRQERGGIIATTLRVNYNGERRTLAHLLFPNWPDHEASSPDHFGQLFELLDRVRASPFPIVIHCSAGIGRSGTLVALEMALIDAVKLREIDVVSTVRKLRGFRCSAVQTFP